MQSLNTIVTKYSGILFCFIPLIVIGLIGAIIAGRTFAAPFGAALGVLLGLIMAAYETMRIPKGTRRSYFTTYVRSGIPGGYRRDDSRVVMTVMMAIFGALSAIFWQFILIML